MNGTDKILSLRCFISSLPPTGLPYMNIDFRHVLKMTVMFSCFSCSTMISKADDRPNIIVFYTDDHGYADLSCQGVFDDIKTPHVDALAANGVRALHGYSTAPQCVPSRAGLMIGKFQSRFGLESNASSLQGFNNETTIAQRLQKAGYMTAQFGKWHLGPSRDIPNHGFRHVYAQNSQGPFSANVTLDGQDQEMQVVRPEMYHIDACSHAAVSLIKRYHDQPLFLYVAYRAPHVPLDAPKKYLDRFPGEMPQRRRQALAMLSAVDDGVGLVMQTIEELKLTEKTLVFYIGDNGAPLKIHKHDAPGGGPGWDGSLNDPLNGEKGMLTEGGMHTPFVVSWPGRIPGGQIYPHPISALDVAATSAEVSGIEAGADEFDGVNLLPFLSGENKAAPHQALMWRWVSQSAIREGDWKLLRGGDREYLFNLKNDIEERHNLTSKHPDIVSRLRARLREWSQELDPPGLANGKPSKVWNDYFDFYLEGKEPAPLREKFIPETSSSSVDLPWTLRNGSMQKVGKTLEIQALKSKKAQLPFLARNGLNLASPTTIEISMKSESHGQVMIAWRTEKEKEFTSKNRLVLIVAKNSDWQKLESSIPTQEKIIHLRVQFPAGNTSLRSLTVKPEEGKSVELFH